MILEVHKPDGFVGHFVDSLVFYSNYTPEHKIERLLPDGVQNLVIDLTEEPKHIFDNDSLERQQQCKRAWFSGARNNLLTIDAGGVNSSMMVVSFKYGAAYHFSHFPMHELTGQVIDSDLAFGDLVLELREEVLQQEAIADKFKKAEQYLSMRLVREEIPKAVRLGTEYLVASPMNTNLQYLTDQCGYSQKHFIQLFKKHVGLTPKAFQKIQRFQKILVEIEKSQEINWARLAVEYGYYDQAHFINEFKKFSGFNPEKYLVEKGPEINYVPIR